MEQSLKQQDYHHAFIYGEKLFSLNPKIEKLYETLLNVIAKTKNWNQLINITDKAYSNRIIKKEEANENKSIALFEIAKIKMKSDDKEAKCGAKIYLDKIPHKLIIKKALPKNRLYEAIIGGGEDYELCFTANSKDSKKIKYLSKKHKIKITKIGTITKRDLKYYDHDKEIKMNLKGFDHFSS